VVGTVNLGYLRTTRERPGDMYAVHSRLGPGVGEADHLNGLESLAKDPGKPDMGLVRRIERDALCHPFLERRDYGRVSVTQG